MEDKVVYCGNLATTVQLTDRVYLRLGNLPVRDQCNVGIVETTRGIVLVDYPQQEPDEEIIHEAESLLGKPVTHIFFTHAHGDHRNGLTALHRRNIQLIGSVRYMDEMAHVYPDLMLQMRAVRPGQQVKIDDITIDFWQPSTIPTHSPWDMVILLQDEDIAFTGDFLVPPLYLYFHTSNWENWKNGLAEFAQGIRQTTMAMGHGAVEQRTTACAVTLEYMKCLTDLWQVTQGCGRPTDITHPLFQKACGYTNCETVLRQMKEIALLT